MLLYDVDVVYDRSGGDYSGDDDGVRSRSY